jgi:hypothetical protein
VNNDSARSINVGVNGRVPLVVPAETCAYTGPEVNERLRTLEVAFVEDPDKEEITFNTFDDDIVLHVSGPPLKVLVSHESHPSRECEASRALED